MDQVSIQGFPRQIPDGDPNRIDSLVVPGPALPGTYVNEVKQPTLCAYLIKHFINLFISHVLVAIPFIYIYIYIYIYVGFVFSATIERTFVRVPYRLFGERIFGRAQLTGKIL